MDFLHDPIILAFSVLVLLVGILMFRSQQRPDIWLPVTVILIFALPRAGLILPFVDLPLPLAHILASVFIIEWLVQRQKPVSGGVRFNRFFLFYAIAAGVGLMLGLIGRASYIVIFMELCFYLFVIGIFFYASETFFQQRHFLLFFRMVLVISVLVSLYGISQMYLGSRSLVPNVTYTAGGASVARTYVEAKEMENIRVLSSYGDPNVLASQLVVFVGMALALVIGAGISWGVRLLCLGVLIINVLCIVCTGSRMALICLLIVPIIILGWRTRWAFLMLPLIVLAGFLWAPQLIQSRLGGQFQGVIEGTEGRLMFPEMAWELFKGLPFGCGFGRKVALQMSGLDWSFIIKNTQTIWASGFNSFWLNMFCRLGVPGLLSFLLVLIVLFRYIWCQARMVNDVYVKAVLVGTLAGFVGQGAIWMINNTYMLPGGGLNFWFTMGMMVAGCRAFAVQTYPTMLPVQPQWLARQVATA